MGTIINQQTKVCSKCKEERPLDEFNKNSGAKDGLQRYCKECNKLYGRKYYIENSSGIRMQRKGAALERQQIKELERLKKEKDDPPLDDFSEIDDPTDRTGKIIRRTPIDPIGDSPTES